MAASQCRLTVTRFEQLLDAKLPGLLPSDWAVQASRGFAAEYAILVDAPRSRWTEHRIASILHWLVQQQPQDATETAVIEAALEAMRELQLGGR